MSDLLISENHKLARQELITQTHGYEASDKYQAISTQNVLDLITDHIGYKPKIVGFNESRTRIDEKKDYVKHALMVELNDSQMIGGTNLRLVLFNSNDRSAALKIYIGVYRIICSNNSIVGSNMFEPVKIIHKKSDKKDWRHSIYSLMNEYDEKQKQTEKIISCMLDKYTSYGDIGRFTERVADEIINPSITGSVLDPLELNVAHRKEDIGKNLFLTYQRIQENLIQGNFDRIIQKEDDDGHLFDSISKGHKITDIKKNIEVNRKLSDFALELL